MKKALYILGIILITINLLSITSLTVVQTYAGEKNNGKEITDSTHQKLLQSLLQEHAAIAAVATINRFDNRPEFEESKKLAEQNAELLAEEVGSLYGSDVQEEFLTLWKRHLALFVRYTDAVKNDDQELKEETLAKLDDFVIKLSDLLAKDNRLPREISRPLLEQHVALEQAVIDAHAAEDYATQYEKMHEGFEHAGMMANQILENLQK